MWPRAHGLPASAQTGPRCRAITISVMADEARNEKAKGPYRCFWIHLVCQRVTYSKAGLESLCILSLFKVWSTYF